MLFYYKGFIQILCRYDRNFLVKSLNYINKIYSNHIISKKNSFFLIKK